jgi:hypothetical protein
MPLGSMLYDAAAVLGSVARRRLTVLGKELVRKLLAKVEGFAKTILRIGLSSKLKIRASGKDKRMGVTRQ